MNYLRYAVKLIVLNIFCSFALTVHAGSFEDFFKAVKLDDESAVVGLALRGFDLNTRNEDGDPGLTLALREGSLKVASFLLTQRSVKAELRNPAGESPLMIAAIKGHLELARALIRRGAEVNKPGWTPLHYAASRPEPDSLDMVRLLLEHHAYIDAESPNKTTPLMMAAMYGDRSVVRLLVEEGADASLRNEQGLTAVDFARRADRQDMADLIAARLRSSRPAAR
jgi:uncharacterized protein